MSQYNSKATPADTAALFAMILLTFTVLVLAGIYFLRQSGVLTADYSLAENILPHIVNAEADVTELPQESETVTTTVTTVTEATETSAPETVSETETETEPEIIVPTDYDKEFFDKIFMVGDSISVGIVNYGFLQPENVFAQIGLTPSSVMTTDIDEVNVYDKALALEPEYICIMLGTNGLSYLSLDYMTHKMDEFIDALRQTCPEAGIVLISIPPVTEEHAAEKPENLENISEYNRSIEALAEEKSVIFVDLFSLLQNREGYLADTFAENDGLHFKYEAYPVLLSAVQSAIEAWQEEHPEEAAEQEAITVWQPETEFTEEQASSVTGSQTEAEQTSVNVQETVALPEPEVTVTVSAPAEEPPAETIVVSFE